MLKCFLFFTLLDLILKLFFRATCFLKFTFSNNVKRFILLAIFF